MGSRGLWVCEYVSLWGQIGSVSVAHTHVPTDPQTRRGVNENCRCQSAHSPLAETARGNPSPPVPESEAEDDVFFQLQHVHV